MPPLLVRHEQKRTLRLYSSYYLPLCIQPSCSFPATLDTDSFLQRFRLLKNNPLNSLPYLHAITFPWNWAQSSFAHSNSSFSGFIPSNTIFSSCEVWANISWTTFITGRCGSHTSYDCISQLVTVMKYALYLLFQSRPFSVNLHAPNQWSPQLRSFSPSPLPQTLAYSVLCRIGFFGGRYKRHGIKDYPLARSLSFIPLGSERDHLASL